ncbi:hypothetical protein [Dehalobacterium formicoaceticum]|uniref:hypothetical protein n=1 Tax=Dehalobacterium formicoaceticum TaxID=51515 RepID=UPI0012FAD313|nr:hypothetical protein [Dehalobacterium formicoaceticum]
MVTHPWLHPWLHMVTPVVTWLPSPRGYPRAANQKNRPHGYPTHGYPERRTRRTVPMVTEEPSPWLPSERRTRRTVPMVTVPMVTPMVTHGY